SVEDIVWLVRIWWIEEHDVERVAGVAQPRERAAHICADDSIAFPKATPLEVIGYELQRARFTLDECHSVSTATESPDADRARSGVAVEHAGTNDARGEDVEQRLPKLVGRRPQPAPRRRFQAAAFQRARDNSHVGFSKCSRGPHSQLAGAPPRRWGQ